MKTKVLMIEDCVETIQRFESFLGAHFDFYFSTSLREAEATLMRSQNTFQIVILNMSMDGNSTLPFARSLKHFLVNKNSALLFVSASDALAARLAGLELADEFLPLCISEQEMLLRVRSCEKRITPSSDRISFADVTLESAKQSVTAISDAGKILEIPLTRTEYRILFHLMTAKDGAAKREEIHFAVWGRAAQASRSLDVHLCMLRKKLSVTPIEIVVVYREGYRLRDQREGPEALTA